MGVPPDSGRPAWPVRSWAQPAHQREEVVVTFGGRRLPPRSRGGDPSRGTGAGRGPDSASFRRVVDMPFEPCVAALESWLRGERHDDELQVGRSRLRGPVVHDPDWGTFRVEV